MLFALVWHFSLALSVAWTSMLSNEKQEKTVQINLNAKGDFWE